MSDNCRVQTFKITIFALKQVKTKSLNYCSIISKIKYFHIFFFVFQNENDDDNWSMAEEMLNELLGDFTNNSNDEIRRVQQKRSDSAFSASTTSSGSADDVDTDSNHILTYKRWI